MRALLIALLALALLAPAAGADDPSQHPPTMPNSTAGAKKCKKKASRYGASFKVFVTKGKSRISCARARKIVSHKPLTNLKHYQYFDWTKGGNGPWSDVYYRHDHKVVIGAIIQGY
jgi:hypothetical protein